MGDLVRRLIKEMQYQTTLAQNGSFQTSPAFDRRTVTTAQSWLMETELLIVESKRSDVLLAPSQATKKKLGRDSVSATIKKEARSFMKQKLEPEPRESLQGYIGRIQAFWTLQPLAIPNGHVHFQCSCPLYMLHGSCKHALGCSFMKNKAQVPAEWQINRLESANKRGRPAKAAAALHKQPMEKCSDKRARNKK
jgi:hypothetical protein